jgi:hypothetical protein
LGGLAGGPGLGSLGATPSVDEAARQLLRALSERGQVGELVAYLRESKPLVEWPEPLPEPLPEPVPVPEIEPLAALPPGLPPAPARTAAAATTVTEPDAPPAVPPPPGLRGAPPAPSPAPPPAQAAPVSTGQPIRFDPTDDEADASRVRPAFGDAERARLVRIAIVAGAALFLVVVAVIIGFAAGRSGAPSAAGAPAAGAQDQPSLARATADDLAAAVAEIAKACGLSDSTGPTREVLAQAFRRCDRSSLPTLPPLRSTLPEPPEPSPNAAGDRAGAGAGQRPAAPAAPAAGGCIKRCQTEHQQCKANECGAEPTQASQYEEYQRCLTRCLNKSAQCKMRCG